MSQLSEEKLLACKQKMSKSHKGRIVSEKTRKKLSEINKGKYYLTEEAKERVRQKLILQNSKSTVLVKRYFISILNFVSI